MENERDTVIHLSEDESRGHLVYQVGYKTVGNADFFSEIEVRHTILDCLDRRAIKTQVKLQNVQIFDYGLTFVISTPLTLDLHKFLMRTAQELINAVNQQYPDLNLKQMAPSGVLSRLWHRPYYIRTLDGVSDRSLTDYLA